MKPVWGRMKAEGLRISFPIMSELLWVRHNIVLTGSAKTVFEMTLSGWRQRGMGVVFYIFRWSKKNQERNQNFVTCESDMKFKFQQR